MSCLSKALNHFCFSSRDISAAADSMSVDCITVAVIMITPSTMKVYTVRRIPAMKFEALVDLERSENAREK